MNGASQLRAVNFLAGQTDSGTIGLHARVLTGIVVPNGSNLDGKVAKFYATVSLGNGLPEQDYEIVDDNGSPITITLIAGKYMVLSYEQLTQAFSIIKIKLNAAPTVDSALTIFGITE